MTFKHGKDAALWLEAANLSAYFNSADLSIEVDTADASTWGVSWKKYVEGLANGSIDAGGLYDPTTTDIQDALAAGGKVLTAGPAGLAHGDDCRLLSVKSTSYNETSPIGGLVAFAWTVIADGQVGLGRVLLAMAEVTATGNGTSYDGGASSANGAIAHLHVTEFGADTTSLDVKVQHSTDGETWADLDSFTQVTAVDAERIEISGSVNRYLRVAYTFAGDDPAATFAVALARL